MDHIDITEIDDLAADDLAEALNLLVTADPSMLQRLETLMDTLQVQPRRQEEITGIDFLSGLPVRGSRRPLVRLSNGHDYDSLFLTEYLLETKENRTPEYDLKDSDFDLLAESNSSVSSRLQQLKNISPVNASAATSIINFCSSNSEAIALQILGICELVSINTLEETQSLFEMLWYMMIRNFAVILKVHPLKASCLAIKFLDFFSKVSTNDYTYEPTVLRSVLASMKALCVTLITSVANGNESNVLNNIQSVFPVKFA
jgi:hypothetical protein